MIDAADIDAIKKSVDGYWGDVLRKSGAEFYAMAIGKEGGHQLSDKVDQLTTSFINSTHPTRSGFQHRYGKICSRSMGDIWFRNARGEWNPVNVKTGLVGSEGQPNIVSLKRVMESIFERKIDSYYLLIVKFSVDVKSRAVSHRVHFVDLLDWLSLPGRRSVVTFNAGPGQMMLKAKQFFDILASGYAPVPVSIREKVRSLMKLYLRGERNLMRDRAKDRRKFKIEYEGFDKSAGDFAIDADGQMELEIQ